MSRFEIGDRVIVTDATKRTFGERGTITACGLPNSEGLTDTEHLTADVRLDRPGWFATGSLHYYEFRLSLDRPRPATMRSAVEL